MSQHIAIDIGASSGRHMLGGLEKGRMTLEEAYRFENTLVNKNGHLCWDTDALFAHILAGLKACKEQAPTTVGIDTWGVDFVLLDDQMQPLGDCVSYRDSRTQGMDTKLNQSLSESELFALTGIAKQPFNTIYQLMALFAEHPEYRDKAKHFLMMPDYLGYLLTGKLSNEYTNASTTGMLDAKTGAWCVPALKAAGIPLTLFGGRPAMAGTALGTVKQEIADVIGYAPVVIIPATHDTGSAYMAVPARDENAVYLSSGTWSLLGVELDAPRCDEKSRLAGFTNEGGYAGNKRYLKNIMGLWMLQCIRRELPDKPSFGAMADMAAGSSYQGYVDATDTRFLAPDSMTQAVKAALHERGYAPPETTADLLRAVNVSLAKCYAQSIGELEQLTGKRFTSMNIVGGGCQNALLDQLTADETGLPVYAGPTEGTALGNLIAQLLSCGELPSLGKARDVIREQFEVKVYTPNK